MSTETGPQDDRHLITLRERMIRALLAPRYGGPQHNTPGGLPLTATPEEGRRHRAGQTVDRLLSALPAELATLVTRAIFALKSPPPAGSEHYRSGWDDGVEAAMGAARDALVGWLAPAPDAETAMPAAPSAAVRKTLRRWAYAAGHIESELDGAVDRMYELVARDVLGRVVPEARVRALHQPLSRAGFVICAHCSGWNGVRCLGLVRDYPCDTIVALDGAPAAAPDHEHVWVTALDGMDQPARDADGRTWPHCGVCGTRRGIAHDMSHSQPPTREERP